METREKYYAIMKNIIYNTIIFFLLNTSGFAATNENQKSNEEKKIKTMTQIEDLWTEQKIGKYYSHIKDVISYHKDKAKEVSSRNELKKIMKTLMEKDNCAKDYDARGVFYESETAKALWKKMDCSESDYVENVVFLASYVGYVRGEMIPNFKWLPVTANVPPPFTHSDIPGWIRFSGMNPNAIPDPEIRKEYLERIEENSQNNRMNERQFTVENASKWHTMELLKHLKTAFVHSERDMNLLLECVKVARLNEEEIESVCKKLNLNENERKTLCGYL